MSRLKTLKKRHKILILLILVIIIGFVAVRYMGPRFIIQVKGGPMALFRPAKSNPFPKPEDFSLNYERISIRSRDDLHLKGILVRSNTDQQKGTIILVHGIRARKEMFLTVAKQLADSNYNSVIMDLRAHGESEGKYCTFGYLEKEDISILVDTLMKRERINKNLGIWGQSLGGAVALQAMAINPEIKYGIIESTFSDFNLIVHDYFRYFMSFDIPFLTNYFIYRAGKITTFDPKDVKPHKYARKIKQPVLMVHGCKDERISIEYGKKNFDNLTSTDKVFIEIPDAGHMDLWEKGGNEYNNKVFEFLRRQNQTP
jgi:pimeloyl-ACP methyl ester carboxylesterase